MIQKEEIDRLAIELSVNPTDIQRDYVNGWILQGIFKSSLKDILVLKGGNALRKGYFPNTRYSKDLDFSTPSQVDEAFLLDEMRKVCAGVSLNTAVVFEEGKLEVKDKKRVSKDIDVLEVRAYFLDFYGGRQDVPIRVYMDVTQDEKMLLDVQARSLIHPYSVPDSCAATIRCMALEEILASKLKCLLQRQHVPDLFDYMRWVFFEDAQVDRGLLLTTFLKKTIYSRAPGAAFRLLIGLPAVALEGYWNKFITSPSTCSFAFADGYKKFMDHLHELFGDQKDHIPYRLSFFSPELRQLIMNAGRNKHLMELSYDGATRVIEPYSLKLRIRQDGGGGEYFYAYNRSGGSSPPDIRAFVPEKIQGLKELDEVFDPRFEIEVCKAGDIPQNPHFSKGGGSSASSTRKFVPGFGITRTRSTASRRGYTGPKYKYRCTYCGRLFSKTKQDAKLGEHKDKSGYRCSGSWGAYEGYV